LDRNSIVRDAEGIFQMVDVKKKVSSATEIRFYLQKNGLNP
jgi:hypothetical protein